MTKNGQDTLIRGLVSSYILVMLMLGMPTTSWSEDGVVSRDGPVVVEKPIKDNPKEKIAEQVKPFDVIVSGPFRMEKASKWDAFTLFIGYAIPFFEAKETAIAYSYPFEALKECETKADWCGIVMEKSALVYSKEMGNYDGYYWKVNLINGEGTDVDIKAAALKNAEERIATMYGEPVEPMYLATINKLKWIKPKFELVIPAHVIEWPGASAKETIQ